MKTLVALFIWLILAGAFASGETAYLGNGAVLLEKTIESNEDLIITETEHEKSILLKESIEKIVYSEETIDNFKQRNFAILWRPLPLAIGLLAPADLVKDLKNLRLFFGGLFFPSSEFVLEAQTALSRQFALNSILDLGITSDQFGISLQIGPQFRPKGEYLKGFFLGIYPGIGIYSLVDWHFLLFLNLETGYQWLFNSGFVIGLSAGAAAVYRIGPILNLSAQIGYAFKHPWIRAK